MKKFVIPMVLLTMSIANLNAECTKDCNGCKKNSFDLKINVSGITELEGNLLICIGDMSVPQAVKGDMRAVDDYEMTFSFDNVEYGEIPVNVFQDLNGNNNLDFDEWGRPVEPCFSEKLQFSEKNNVLSVELKEY